MGHQNLSLSDIVGDGILHFVHLLAGSCFDLICIVLGSIDFDDGVVNESVDFVDGSETMIAGVHSNSEHFVGSTQNSIVVDGFWPVRA